MSRVRNFIPVAACLVAMVAFAETAEAQSGPDAIAVDQALAKQGQSLYRSRGCNACHVLGKRGAGPDLLGVTDRRDPEWLTAFITDPATMLATDPVAQELLKEWRGIKMPNIKLTEAQVQALVHYLADETAKAQK